MKFHIITRCTRAENLLTIADSVYKEGVDVTWHIVFDTGVVRDIDASLLGELSKLGAILYFKQGSPGTYMYLEMNKIINSLYDLGDFVTLIDDDNIVHPDYYDSIIEAYNNSNNERAFCYNQLITVDNPTYRHASPSNTVVGGIDLAQFTVRVDTFIHASFGSGYCGDGEFIQALHNEYPEDFVFINKTLCYYNYLQQVTPKKTSAPKILYIGEGKPELKSTVHLGYEDTSLNVEYVTNRDLSLNDYNFSEYDSIISIGEHFEDVPLLSMESLDIRKRWYNSEDNIDNIGELSYNVAMQSILDNYKPQISFFTPAYKTPIKRIERLYNSLCEQFMVEWEWVVVNDSPEDKAISDWLTSISKIDSRVKVFTFLKPSGGIIGEVKYRAASLCRADIIAELDHDDELLPLCSKYIIDASVAHPECGFFYTNCVEVDENYNSLKYPDGFAFGYGSYRKTFDISVRWEYEQSVCVGINPKTIRHIVGVPNHIRAWRRDVYNKIGGHNRRLSIADDYELIVRTFLSTKFCHIDACGYIQFIYNNNTGQNTHDATRGDIQRRVRTIAMHYNNDIANRFYYLGVKDWAYEYNPVNPLLSKSRFGEEECRVDVTYTPNS